ncbi:MAG: 16S rRNA (guanine(966)-N(2))-methyltransferase RsmD [Gemmatimonadales bacterium]|nr:16S rRNA (guanine(966)-N(2))-methyltransferase RsmD [Gemmatimonadales bacterium]
MRIVGGELGGRRLARPDDARVRPTADRVREALMSILAGRLEGARVLDLFAGSGALGLEALSRGAAHAEFVDVGARSLDAIRRNIEALGVGDRATVRRGDALRVIAGLAAGAYDIAFADPPYRLGLAPQVVARFRAVPFARLLVVEHDPAEPVAGDDARRYGDTVLTFLEAP